MLHEKAWKCFSIDFYHGFIEIGSQVKPEKHAQHSICTYDHCEVIHCEVLLFKVQGTMTDKPEKNSEKGFLARTATYTTKRARRAQEKVLMFNNLCVKLRSSGRFDKII